MKPFEQVWQHIIELEGSQFQQVRGKNFTYSVSSNTIIPSTTNYLIPRSQIEKAWSRKPFTGPGALSDLIAPSYLFVILTDSRI